MRFKLYRAVCLAVACCVSVILLLAGIGAFGGEASVPANTKDSYRRLLSIDLFAFGGIGFAGVRSDGESCFYNVAASTNALELFKAALTNGTSEARMYALCGIRRFAPEEFNTAAAPIIKSSSMVRTMSGCIGFNEPASNVVASIKAGEYDSYIKPKKSKR